MSGSQKKEYPSRLLKHHSDQHILEITRSDRNQIWAMRMESGRKWKPARPIVNG